MPTPTLPQTTDFFTCSPGDSHPSNLTLIYSSNPILVFGRRNAVSFPSILSSPSLCSLSPMMDEFSQDFNCNLYNYNTYPTAWNYCLEQHFSNVITAPNSSPLSTFNNGRHRTCINFIFRPHNLTTNALNAIFLNPFWTDHSLLTVSLPLQRPSGPGVWRFNTMFLTLDSFTDQLDLLLDFACTSLRAEDSLGSQLDTLKELNILCTANAQASSATEPCLTYVRWKLILQTTRLTRLSILHSERVFAERKRVISTMHIFTKSSSPATLHAPSPPLETLPPGKSSHPPLPYSAELISLDGSHSLLGSAPPSEISSLFAIMDLYSRASNTRVNTGKTVGVYLSGVFVPDWGPVLTAAETTNLHDYNSTDSIRYLGFSLTSHPRQLDTFRSALLSKLGRNCLALAQHRLSVRDKDLIANTLLLSTIRYVLYVMPAPASSLVDVRKTTRQYLSLGFGLLDLENQQKALQLRWILSILRDSYAHSKYALPYIIFLLQLDFFKPSPAIAPVNLPTSTTALCSFLPRWNHKGLYVYHTFVISTQSVICCHSLYCDIHARNRLIAFFHYLDTAKIFLWSWFASLLLPTPPDSPNPNDGFYSLLLLVEVDGHPLQKARTGSLRLHLLPSFPSLSFTDIR
ncbi:hypothetical protein CLU79DRAFT_840396 [Phycomyces nitens]|nr:hypothetical protein CLU79DRAFT_840396 [Phycomyces nitens]